MTKVHNVTDLPKKAGLVQKLAPFAGIAALIAVPTAYVVLKTKTAISETEN